MPAERVTAQRLREALSYEPSTGEFKWLIRPSINSMPGETAGTTDARG